VERLVDEAGDAGFDEVVVFTDATDYLSQFGFESVPFERVPGDLTDRLEAAEHRASDPDEVRVLRLATDRLRMPDDLRARFKRASATGGGDGGREVAELAEEFDPGEDATYKYDTGG
jgi:hypothetical protein